MEFLTMLSFGDSGWGDELLRGLGVTLALALVTAPFALVFSFLVAWGKASSWRGIRVFSNGYTTVFRSLPELLTLIIIYYQLQTLLNFAVRLVLPEANVTLNAFAAGVVALTLTPMMCAKILRAEHSDGSEGGFAAWLDSRFESWREAYKRRLHGALDTKIVIAVFGAIVFASCYFLFISTPGELAPEEDIGFAFSINETDGYSSREYLDQYFAEAQKTALAQDNIDHIFTFASNEGGSTNTGFMGLILPPWDDRSATTGQVVNQLLPELEKVAGIRPAVIVPPALPTPAKSRPGKI